MNKIFLWAAGIFLSVIPCVAGNSKERTMKDNVKEIYFAGGCFWGTEHFMKQIRGVMATEVGYANGNVANPDYRAVCTGNTGFAETVKVEYDALLASTVKAMTEAPNTGQVYILWIVVMRRLYFLCFHNFL